MTLRSRTLTGAAAVVGLGLTLLLTIFPFVEFSYRSPSLHVALETGSALIALLGGYLVFGRFRQSRQLSDLLLVYALVLLCMTDILRASSSLPAATPGELDPFATWAPVATTFLAAALLALAAWAPDTQLRRTGSWAVGLPFLATGAFVVTVGAVAAFAAQLPVGIAPGIAPVDSGGLRLVGNPVILAGQLEAFVFYAAAAAGFTIRAERSGDELTRWLAAGAVLAAFARLNYFLFPSLYSDWLYTGDLLRIGFYLCLLVGAGREIRVYWSGLANAAVLEERRRIARDLHDGLAQELAFIVARAPQDDHVRRAAERALDESRRAIAALTRPVDEPLEVALAQTAEEVAGRVGAAVRLDLLEGIEVSPDEREALLRIVREAVTNAARHGHAAEITVELSNGQGTRLLVRDDGSGFDPEAARTSGFGLVSMRERAQAIGGEFSLRSAPGRGTEVEVLLS